MSNLWKIQVHHKLFNKTGKYTWGQCSWFKIIKKYGCLVSDHPNVSIAIVNFKTFIFLSLLSTIIPVCHFPPGTLHQAQDIPARLVIIRHHVSPSSQVLHHPSEPCSSSFNHHTLTKSFRGSPSLTSSILIIIHPVFLPPPVFRAQRNIPVSFMTGQLILFYKMHSPRWANPLIYVEQSRNQMLNQPTTLNMPFTLKPKIGN